MHRCVEVGFTPIFLKRWKHLHSWGSNLADTEGGLCVALIDMLRWTARKGQLSGILRDTGDIHYLFSGLVSWEIGSEVRPVLCRAPLSTRRSRRHVDSWPAVTRWT